MSFIKLVGVNKIYPNGVRAVTDFNLEINEREFVVFVGPSGCGKSTTLRMIAGLEDISGGEIYIDDVLVNNVEPKNRGIAMVFQNYALYPHMTVKENMAFSLKIKRVPKEEINERVEKVAEIIGLSDYLNKKPSELSGGQRQRVALGRAIIRNPKVFLMDEPLSNLDAKLRTSMRSEIINIHKKVGATTIYVTHDQVEAMTMADKIVVMKDGFVQQVGSPIEIYDNPSNLFVASFLGSPTMNLYDVKISKGKMSLFGEEIKIDEEIYSKLEETLKANEEELTSDIKELEVLVQQKALKKKNAKILSLFKKKKQDDSKNPLTYENQLSKKQSDLMKTQLLLTQDERNLTLGFRPTDIYFVKDKNINLSNEFKIQVDSVELLGHDVIVHARCNEQAFLINRPAKEFDFEQKELSAYLDLDKLYFFDSISGRRIK